MPLKEFAKLTRDLFRRQAQESRDKILKQTPGCLATMDRPHSPRSVSRNDEASCVPHAPAKCPPCRETKLLGAIEENYHVAPRRLQCRELATLRRQPDEEFGEHSSKRLGGAKNNGKFELTHRWTLATEVLSD